MSVRTNLQHTSISSHIQLLGTIALLAIASACAEAPTAPANDSWSLTPPTLVTPSEVSFLEKTDVRKITPTQSSKLSPLAPKSPMKLPLESHIAFAKADLGLPFQFRSQCGNETFSGDGKTSDAVALASLLPPTSTHLALTKKNDDKEVVHCTVELIVFSHSGSSHSFGLYGFALQPSNEERGRRFSLSYVEPQARFAIFCGTWWAKEQSLVAGRTILSPTRRIEALASGPVHGTDQRSQIWNPACATFRIDQDGQETYLGLSHPLKNSRQIEIRESFPLNHTRITLSAKQTLASWTIVNPSSYPQVLRIEGFSGKMRVAFVSSADSFVQWGRPVVLGIATSVSTPEGQGIKALNGETFVHLEPKQTMKVEMTILTQSFCHAGRLVPGAVAMRLQTELPLALEQIETSMDPATFLKTDVAALKELPRSNRRTLLHRADLAPEQGKPNFVRIANLGDESFTFSPGANASCIGGDPLSSHAYALPE